ncbi:MAG: DUF2130 domain-containing protein [bacterium]
MNAMEPTIVCPKCQAEIKLTESLAAPLIESTKREFERKLAEKDTAIAAREGSIREREQSLVKEKAALEDQVAARLTQERTKIATEEAKKAKTVVAMELEQKAKENTELQDALNQQNAKLAEAQAAQAEYTRKQRELDDAKRELDLTVEKRVQAGLGSIREQSRKEVEEQMNLKVSEKEQIIISMQRKIEELQRKAEQGSQQLQGEVQELEIEALLKAKFPLDTIEPVPKGEHGGDTLQRVVSSLGQACGTILWESKRTKNWSDSWLPKLRDDQRVAKAEIAIIVSQTLPKGVEAFDFVEGVWVAHPGVIMPVALMLRHSLIEVSTARQASEGQQTKMELLYSYLIGPHFRQRVQAIVEAFTTMKQDLDREKKVITKQWAKREEQTERVMQATVSMYGDLQGIAGKSLPEIAVLEMEALEAPEEVDSSSREES